MADLHVREKKLARVAPLSGPSVTIIILWPAPKAHLSLACKHLSAPENEFAHLKINCPGFPRPRSRRKVPYSAVWSYSSVKKGWSSCIKTGMSWTSGTIAMNASNFWQIFLVMLQYTNENLCLQVGQWKQEIRKQSLAKWCFKHKTKLKWHVHHYIWICSLVQIFARIWQLCCIAILVQSATRIL